MPDAEKRPLRKRRYSIDKKEVVDTILDQVKNAEDERAEWMTEREIRYAKMRGWAERDNPPFGDDSANVHVPVIMANSLRVKAGLFNAVMGMRPVMTPKTTQRRLQAQAEQANNLIDYQIFVEGQGERVVDAYVDQFVDEPAVFSHQRWSKEKTTLHDVRVFPTPDRPIAEWMAEQASTIVEGISNLVMRDADGYHWTADRTDPEGDTTEVDFKIYDRDERKIEVCLEWEATVFDGPAITVHDLEDVVLPVRCENPQPVSPSNPAGAPWVARLIRVNMDHVRRMQRNGTYDQLTAEDVAEESDVEGEARGREGQPTTTFCGPTIPTGG